MGKVLLREYYELCEGGVCQDLLTEDEKRFEVSPGGIVLVTPEMLGQKRHYVR